MLRATVKGNVWSTKRLKEIPHGAMLEVELDDGKGTRLVAFDVLGCGVGERVLVSTGRFQGRVHQRASPRCPDHRLDRRAVQEWQERQID